MAKKKTKEKAPAPQAPAGAEPAPQAPAGGVSAPQVPAGAQPDSEAPNAGHTSSPAVDAPGVSEQAPGGENPAGDASGQLEQKEPEGGWCYPVIEPFMLGKAVIKPARDGEATVFVQLTTDEAAPLLAAGVIGDDACYPPEADAGDGE